MAVAANNCCFQVSSAKPKFPSVLVSQPPKSSFRMRVRALGISETFSNLRRQKKAAFIPYITAGDPDLSTTATALKLLNRSGADIIELGLPFNDPVLDGPVIQASNKRALASKTNVKSVISMLREVVPQISCPIVIFSYYNLILYHNVEWFLSALEDVGVQGNAFLSALEDVGGEEWGWSSGLIVPDLPFEESATLKIEAAKKNIDMVLLTTPTTGKEKMKAIADASEGFLYLVSSSGVTGARATVNSQLQFLLKEIKEETAKPVAVGFGISKPEHVKQLSSWGADGVIVGSAIVDLLGKARSAEEGLKHVESFVTSLRAALPHRDHALGEAYSPSTMFQERRESWQGPQSNVSSSSLLQYH